MATHVTSFAANVHCPTCITTAKQALAILSPPPSKVAVDLLNQTITIHHDPSLAYHSLAQCLMDAGFELDLAEGTFNQRFDWLAHRKRKRLHRQHCQLCSVEQATQRGGVATVKKVQSDNDASDLYTTTLSITGIHCAACISSIQRELDSYKGSGGIVSAQVNILDKSATITHHTGHITIARLCEIVKSTGKQAEVMESRPAAGVVDIQVDQTGDNTKYQVDFNVGGMTCASCSGTITVALKNAGFEQVGINLVSKTGSAVVCDRADEARLVQIVIDLGYDCDVSDVTALGEGNGIPENARTVKLRLEGVESKEQIGLICERLRSFSWVLSASTFTLEKPLLVLTYITSPPLVTLRTVVSELKGVSANITVSPEKAMTVEQRARRLQKREKSFLLARILAAVVFAIPTFIIGIVCMMLLPDSSSLRMYWMMPIWGNASRGLILMWCLATPVQFVIASHFHVRSYYSLRSLWRRGSNTPFWKRLVRFGSMDLLVSLGTFAAYISSLVLLILDVQAPIRAQGNTTTYFRYYRLSNYVHSHGTISRSYI